MYLEEISFSNTDINSIQLSASLDNISNNAFKNCSKLQVITINADDTVIGSGAFSGCVSLKSVVNADKITFIGRNAFHNCKNLKFYFSENSSNTYISNYIQEHDFNLFSSIITNIYGYAARMNHYQETRYDLYMIPLPYSTGSASLYTIDKEYIETVNIDSTGKFSFDNIKIGEKYRIVLDGKTAIPREEFFVAATSNYCIAPENNCFAVIACDYNKDGILSSQDTLDFRQNMNTSSLYSSEKEVFDFDGNKTINSYDLSVLSGLFYKYKDCHTFY